MAIKLNPYIDEQNHHRCHTNEQRYIRDLDRRGLLLRIENTLVDAEQLVLRSFQCDSGYCTKCTTRGGVTKFKGSCCSDLEVNVTEEEIRRLKLLGKMAQEKLTLGARDPLGQAVERLAKGSFYETTEGHELAFKHLPSGRCALSTPGPGGAIRCSINSLCMALELPLTEYKPDPCYLFPLHYAEPVPGTFFVTLISAETHSFIGADKYVGKLACLARPQPGSPPAYQFLRSEIDHCFHGGLYAAIHAAAGPILAKHGLAAAGAGAGMVEVAGEGIEPPLPRPDMAVAN